MGTKYIIRGAKRVNQDQILAQIAKHFADDQDAQINQFILDPDDDEIDARVAFVEMGSIAGVKITKLKNRQITVFLGMNAGGLDLMLAFRYLRALQEKHPEAVITCQYVNDHNNEEEPADLSEEAMNHEMDRRMIYNSAIIESDVECIHIPGLRYTYHFKPRAFMVENRELNFQDRIIKFYETFMKLQWSNPPQPKTYLLKWNPAISSVTLQDYERGMKAYKAGNFYYNWSIWDWQDVNFGDTVYLLCGGEGKTGICMRGTVTSDSYRDKDWSGKGRDTHYVDFFVNEMVNPEKGEILPTEELQKLFPNIEWTGGHSGILLDEVDATFLDVIYDRYLVDHRTQFSVERGSTCAIATHDIPTEYKVYYDTAEESFS